MILYLVNERDNYGENHRVISLHFSKEKARNKVFAMISEIKDEECRSMFQEFDPDSWGIYQYQNLYYITERTVED